MAPVPTANMIMPGDDGSHVRVENRCERVGESRVNRGFEALAGQEFLAHSFKNQHVGINGHTDRERDAGYAGQGEHRQR